MQSRGAGDLKPEQDFEETDLLELLEDDEFWDDEFVTVEELKMILRFYGIDLQLETLH